MHLRIPDKLGLLLEPARIKVIFGGRGGGKTVSISDIFIAKTAAKKTRLLCLREFQNSIADSVHSTLENRIKQHGVEELYRILTNEIHGSNGSQVIYGQLARNIESIKSKDSVDYAWVEEAETVSERSIDVLEPSIRAKGSEIWYSLNPKDDEGAVWKRYIKPHLEAIERDGFYRDDKDGGLIVIKINLDDNPFAPQELIDASNKLKRENYRKWRHVYGGEILLEDDDKNLIKTDPVLFATKTDDVERIGSYIVGVDPARFGNDYTAIIRRQGRSAFNLARLKHNDTMQVAGRIVLIIKMENPDMVFIDVGGLGAGIYDRLVEMGYGERVKAVNFGGKPIQADRYLNKRAEMWALMGNWLDDVPVTIPDDNGLVRDLVSTRYSIRSDGKLQLESKDDIKKRTNRSPDAGDALALTFAFPVQKRADEIFNNEASYRAGDTVAGY